MHVLDGKKKELTLVDQNLATHTCVNYESFIQVLAFNIIEYK